MDDLGARLRAGAAQPRRALDFEDLTRRVQRRRHRNVAAAVAAAAVIVMTTGTAVALVDRDRNGHVDAISPPVTSTTTTQPPPTTTTPTTTTVTTTTVLPVVPDTAPVAPPPTVPATVPTTAPTRTTLTIPKPVLSVVNATVVDGDGNPFPAGTAGVQACPTDGFSVPCTHLLVASDDDGDGTVRMEVEPNVEYVFTGYARNTGWPDPAWIGTDGTTYHFSEDVTARGADIEGMVFVVANPAA